MAAINAYPPAAALTGAEILLLVQAGNTVDVTLQRLLATPQARTGQFYQDAGANVARFNDRLMVGAAADNPAQHSRDTAPTDWLTTVMGATSIGAYAVWGAQGASLARYGTIGFLGGSRTSDARAAAALLGYTPASIGLAAWVVNDDTSNPASTDGWAIYGEAWRMPGVVYKPTFACELEAVNFGGLPVGIPNPYAPNVGGGTSAMQLGAGGGQTSGTFDASSAVNIVSNPNSYQVGLVFGATSIVGTNGNDSGYGSAVLLAKGHGIQWNTPEAAGGVTGLNAGATIYSTVSQAAQGGRLVFQNNAVLVCNNAGQGVFSVSTAGTVTNILSVQSGAGAQAAGLYVEEGAGGSPNLGLYPAAGGCLQITSPLVSPGNAPAGVPGYGYMTINVAGLSARVALYTPAQAGG